MSHDLNELPTDAAVGAELARAASGPFDIHGTPHVLIPEGVSLKNCEECLSAPTRLRQVVTLITPAALAAYVGLFGDRARSIIFADAAGCRFNALLDYHADPTAPSWNAHRAMLTLKKTRPWLDWAGANKAEHNQAKFAQFLEDHIPDIAAPAGAELVELARNFEATKAVTFQSSQRVADGSVQFTYNEDVQGTPRAGSMKVPPEILLALSPFEGSSLYRVTARLRYRIGEGGKLALWYDLLRTEELLEQAFADVLAAITKDTAAHVRAVIEGVPA